MCQASVNTFHSIPNTPQVPRLRAERRSFTADPRFNHVVQLVRSGMFGW